MPETNDIKNFTRGGQITLHNLRMFTQIMDKVALTACLVTLIVMSIIFWNGTSQYERYVYGKYICSISWPLVDKESVTDFIQPDGRQTKVIYKEIAHADLVTTII